MSETKRETVQIKTSGDIMLARQKVRNWASELGLTLVDQTKLVTAASELARNTLDYGRGGEMIIEQVGTANRVGLKLIFEDQGPGIPDVELALKDGFTSGNGMGLGLGGSKRLVNEFSIDSEPGKGTRVTIVRWR